MTMRILTGRKFNLFERGIATVSLEHAQLGRTRLYDGRPSRAWRSTSLAADQVLRVDGNLITDGVSDFGGFETWASGSPAGWTEENTGTGAVTEEAAIFNSGAKSAKFTAGTGTASIYRDIVVKAGEILNVQSALRGDGTGIVRLRLYNTLTHKYYDGVATNTWVTAVSDVRTQQAASWSTETETITVESHALCQSDLVTLRLTVLSLTTGGPSAYADDVYIWPRINFASIHGHNIDPGQLVTLRSSTDNWVGSNTQEGTAVPTVPTFYMLQAAGNQDRRYWGIQLHGAPSVIPEIGELVIGYAQQPTQQYENPLEASSRWDRQASITPGGEVHTHKRSKWPIRSRVFHYNFWTQAAYDNARELFHLRPEGDAYPVVVVPDTTRPEVIHGRLRSTFEDALILSEYFQDVAVELEESPFASTAF